MWVMVDWIPVRRLPPITPANSSAAARCAFWSLLEIIFSKVGCKASKGSSSRSWTRELGESEVDEDSLRHEVVVHIDLTQETLS